MKEVAAKGLGDSMREAIKKFKDLLKQTPVDELQIKEYPFVVFRVNANTWVEVVLKYLVPPKQASAVRSRMIKAVIKELLKEPDKAMFPKTNAR